MTDLPKYHSFPPLNPPHEPTASLVDRQDEAWAKMYKPTPTITQMADKHERQVFTDKAERVVNQVLAFALTVLAVVFVGGLMYKTFVWGH
jgi:hypothetical protein